MLSFRFSFTMLVIGLMPLFHALGGYWTFPNVEVQLPELKYDWQVVTPSRCLNLVSTFLLVALIAALESTLAYRLGEKPLGYRSAIIGMCFTLSSICYAMASRPSGRVMNKYGEGESLVTKLAMALAWTLLALCLAAIGPFKLPWDREVYQHNQLKYSTGIV